AGRLVEAIGLYERILADRVRVLGEDHPSTLTSRNNLAYAYESAGRLTEAIPLYQQALADRIRVLGEDHPDTVVSRQNLAGAYWSVEQSGTSDPGPAAGRDRQQAAGPSLQPAAGRDREPGAGKGGGASIMNGLAAVGRRLADLNRTFLSPAWLSVLDRFLAVAGLRRVP
ncbi:MAG: tetratricopeptide repeat protein, partial [Micromonosporaceae bacterium]|nr:tetratricopeptide repeat protein [Micromonosporaceae bacterium]